MKKKTTKEHYEKYRALAQRLGVTLKHCDKVLNRTKEQMLSAFEQDEHLNSVPLRLWDNMAYSLLAYNRGKGLSLSDGVCLYKHLTIYEFLGLEPDFTD